MVSALITALALMTLLCLLLGWACYRFFTDREESMKHEESRRKEWMDEMKEMDRYLSGVLRVLNSSVGGISKRISESAEIAEAIQSQTPDLFKQCDGLAYWLHANDRVRDKPRRSGRGRIARTAQPSLGLAAPKLAKARFQCGVCCCSMYWRMRAIGALPQLPAT